MNQSSHAFFSIFLRRAAQTAGLTLLGLSLAGWLGCKPPASDTGTGTAGHASASASGAGTAAAAPEVSLVMVDYAGLREMIDKHKGKIVVLDCWSTYCQPCVDEFPGLVKLHQKYGPDRVACMSLSFDYEGFDEDGARKRVIEFLTQQGAHFDNALARDPDGLNRDHGIPTIPVVFVYDTEGNEVARFDGNWPGDENFTYADIEAKVKELLGE